MREVWGGGEGDSKRYDYLVDLPNDLEGSEYLAGKTDRCNKHFLHVTLDVQS